MHDCAYPRVRVWEFSVCTQCVLVSLVLSIPISSNTHFFVSGPQTLLPEGPLLYILPSSIQIVLSSFLAGWWEQLYATPRIKAPSGFSQTSSSLGSVTLSWSSGQQLTSSEKQGTPQRVSAERQRFDCMWNHNSTLCRSWNSLQVALLSSQHKHSHLKPRKQ